MAKYKVDFTEASKEQLEALARYCSNENYLDAGAVAAIMGFKNTEGDGECITENARIAEHA